MALPGWGHDRGRDRPDAGLEQGPGHEGEFAAGPGSLIKMETSLDPLLAMIRSSRPLPVRSATVIPTGLVPVK